MIKLACCVLLLAPTLAAWADAVTHPVTLWRIQGQSNAIYLLGSIHLLRDQDHPLPAVIDAAYDDADILIMELDMDDLDASAAQQLFNHNGVRRDGTTLRDLMGEDLYRRAAEIAEANDIPLDLLASSEPWLAAITVEMMALYRLGFNPTLGVEMLMSSRAIDDRKPIEGLETINEQVAFLDGLSLPAQRDMFLQTLQDTASIGESINEMIFAWRHGDIEFLESGLLESFADHGELHEVLVAGRNRRWAARIGELLNDPDDYLIIVGALHLVGEEGVPSLLANKGINIQQLREHASIR